MLKSAVLNWQNEMPVRDSEIAVLQSELRRVNERLRQLEERTDATTALMNKYGGGIAVAILIVGAIWAVIVAFGANVQKAIGH